MIDGIGQKLTGNLVHGKSWVNEFLKGLSVDLFYLISIQTIFSFWVYWCVFFEDDATFYACDMDLNSLTKRTRYVSDYWMVWK